MCSVGIGETLRWALAKLVMRVAGDQAKTACGNLQLCAGLEAGIEGATNAVGQRRLERVRARIVETEGAGAAEAEVQEEESVEVAGIKSNLIIETASTEEEAKEGIAPHLGWRWRRTGGEREKKGLEGLNGH